ncbi:hypothetical protein ACFWYW_39220 [Nonomuraea sp. NPDC059023]|uniref:hypothetical protein n=1 Tax=unclassified Nonomuraea TaxID=2593643 RepID=UPI0036B24A0E
MDRRESSKVCALVAAGKEVLSAPARLRFGGDGFAVTVTSGAAALPVRDLPALPPGVRHIEHLVNQVASLTELAIGRFDLPLDDVREGR